MEEHKVLCLELEFHLFKTFNGYNEFINKHKKKCCKLMNLDFFTENIRCLAGVTRNEYPYVVATRKENAND